jgi:lipopolysaccharide export system permease protein
MTVFWYMASQFLKTVLSILMFALTLYFLITYMEESQHYFDHYHPTFQTVFLYYFWQFPVITVQLMPFAVLIGGIVTNWVLAKNGEIAALRAAGLSVMGLSVPFFCVGFFFTVGQFLMNECVVPESTTKFLQVKKVQIEGKKENNVFMQSTWVKAKDTVLHFKKYNEDKQELSEVEYFKFYDVKSLKEVIHAKSAYFNEKMGYWVLRYAVRAHVGPLGQHFVLRTEFQPQYVTNVDFAPPKVLKQSSDSSQLSFWQLRKLIAKADLAGSNVSDRVVDLYLKISAPFANILFVFLTLPFALWKERQEERYLGIVICLASALLYWFGNMTMRSFAAKGSLSPWIAAWTMNVFVALLSFALIRKLDKGQ